MKRKHYRTIVIDPPWDGPGGCPRFEPDKPTGFIPYQTMTGIQIANLRVKEIAARGAQLFLWATSRNLGDAYLCVQGWGFDYRGLLVWKKPLGMGRHVRHEAEFLIWAVSPGSPQVAPGKAIRQVYTWKKPRRHSEKPAEAYELIRQLSQWPRVDVFARQRRPGFDAWGNEAPAPPAHAAA